MTRAAGWAAATAGSWVLIFLTVVPAADAAPHGLTATSNSYAGYRAGYRIVPKTLAASGNLTVPAVSCPQVTSEVGFFAATETGAPQDFANKGSGQAGVQVLCSSGTASYLAWTEIAGNYDTLPVAVKPGDHVRLSVSTTETAPSSGAITITFTDTTQSYSSQRTGTNPSFQCDKDISCEAIVGATAFGTKQALPIPSFGTAAFTGARLSGVTAKAANAVQVNLVTTAGTRQVQTGNLNKTGDGWKEIFKHS